MEQETIHQGGERRSIYAVIPTYKPGEDFERLLRGLLKQKTSIDRIIVINTEEKLYNCTISDSRIMVYHITKDEFDHAATRQMGMDLAKDADYVLFMTQDAIPVNALLVKKLQKAFDDPRCAVSYARQLPKKDAGRIERMSRRFNYPDQDRTKTKADLGQLGIKTYFCSDVCAMYDRKRFYQNGGFPDHAIFNEDMYYAAHAIEAGDHVVYCSEAKVLHSHNYTGVQQFHRNFDMGVSQREFHEIFDGVPSEGEGIRMVLSNWKDLMKRGAILDSILLIYLSGCKYIGYQLGKHYQLLTPGMIEKCTDSPGYFHKNRKS